MKKPIKYGLFILIILAMLASCTVAVNRVKAENAADSSMMTLSWAQITNIAARNDMTVEEALDYFHDYDNKTLYTGIIFTEPTLKDLQDDGTIAVKSALEFSQQIKNGSWVAVSGDIKVSNTYNYVVCSDEDTMNTVFDSIQNKTDAVAQKITVTENGTPVYIVGTSLQVSDLDNLGTGFPKESMELLASKGLSVTALLKSWPAVDQKSIDYVFDDVAKWDNVVAVGFSDENLPGISQSDWADISKMMAAKFKENDWPLMQNEFFKQKGLSTMAQLLDYHVARMHTVGKDELATIAPVNLIDRYQLAANERGMNLLLYRINTNISIKENAILLEKIDNAIVTKGRPLGEMIPIENIAIPLWVGLLVTLGVGAGGVLLLDKLNFKKWSYILPAVCVLGSWAVIVMGHSHQMYKLLALAGVMIFPLLGIITFVSAEPKSIFQSVLSLIGMTAISLIGAVFVVGLLSTRDYMTGVSFFSGIKVSQLLPLLFLALYYWYQTNILKGYDRNVVVMIRDLLKKPVSVGILVLVGVIIVIFAVYMLRSTNDPEVATWELAFRSFLDSTFGARPRTKEFLFAHPLMLLTMYYGYKKNLWPLLVLGAIGQVSLVNTFEHLHTPLLISILRTAVGLFLGIIIGIILILIVKAAVKWLNSKLSQATAK